MSRNNPSIEDIMPGLYMEAEEVVREIFKRMPFGEKVTLSNGRTFEIVKFTGPAKDQNGSWCFGVDAKFTDNNGPDHLEFHLQHTGGGGWL